MTTYVLDARTATPHFPGIGRYVRSLARAMVPQLGSGERLTLLTDPQHPLDVPGVRILPVTTSPFSLTQQWAVPTLLRQLDADMVHSAYYLMPYRPRVPTLLTVYDLIPLRHPEYSTARARLLFRVTTRLALAAAQHVTAITETARRDFVREFDVDAAQITAIPLAADPVFTPQSAAEVVRVRRQYDLPERFVLYVGSNKPHKNLVGLVRAWGELAVPDGAELVIAGAWDARYGEARALAEVSSAGETIRWLGRVPESDLPALYSAATLFVFPSLFEGFGLPPLEAMACGTPVVCSNVSALPEVVGDAALLFDPSDLQTLALKLSEVLADAALRETLREKGLVRAAQFSWAQTAARTLRLYRQVAGMSA